MKGIKKEIYVLREGLKTDITYVNGTTMIPIELHIADFELPIDSAAVVYSLAAGMSSPKKIVGEIKNNTVVFTPEATFFNVGINVVQVRIVSGIKTLVTFSETVVCKNTMNFEDAGEVESQPTLVQQLLAKITECLEKFKKTEQNITEAIRIETENRSKTDQEHEGEILKINKIYEERILTEENLKLVMEAGKIVDATLIKKLNEDIYMINKNLSKLLKKQIVEHFLTKNNYTEYLNIGNLRGGRIENISGNKVGNVVTLYVQINDITSGGPDVEIFKFKDQYKKKYGPSNYAVYNAYISYKDNTAYIGQFNDGHFTMSIGGSGTISGSSRPMVLFTITYITEE